AMGSGRLPRRARAPAVAPPAGAAAGRPGAGYFLASTLGSRGRPRTFSPMMLRWIWELPPQIVSLRLKKNADSIGLTTYPSRSSARIVAGHEPDSGPQSASIASAP